jgi:4-amino-4-deoxy-L-arabinose transferase-like glycosyltransferase
MAIVACQAATNIWYIASQNTGNPNPGDEAAHVQEIMQHYNRGWASLWDSVYPPFYFFVSLLLHHLLGKSFQISILANMPFFLALIAGVYGIVFRLTKNPFAGLFAMLLVSCYPMVSLLSRMVMFEFPLAGMVALAVWLLLETEGFSRRGVTLVFGAVCGLGQLTRESFFVFMIGPILLELARSLLVKAKPDFTARRARIAVNFALFAALAVLLPALWYAKDPSTKLMMARLSATLQPNHPEIKMLSWRGLLFYPYTILDLSVSIWLSLPCIAALPGFFGQASRQRCAVLPWILVPWIFFSNLDWKLARYLTAMLPALAVITAVGLFAIKRDLLRRSLVIITSAAAVFLWAALTFGFVPKEYLIENGLPAYVTGFRLLPRDYRADIHVGPPEREPWPLEEIAALIAKASKLPDGGTAVRFLNRPEHSSLYENQLSFPLHYFIARDRLTAELLDYYFDENNVMQRLWWRRKGALETELAHADLLISYGADFPSILHQERRWVLIKRFNDRGIEKDVYYNIERVSPSYFQTR